MGWQDQGRQEHGWFGSGTAAGHDDDAGLFGPDGRIEAAGRGAVASLPRALRAQGERQLDAGSSRLSEAMAAWSRGGRLDAAQFAERFFGRGADDAVVAQLRDAAQGVAAAKGHARLREAGERLARAMQAVGLDRWPGFLADAQARARDPATVAAVEASQPATRRHGVDAIRPVYPIETLLGGGAGIGKKVAAAVGEAIVRRILPEGKPPIGDPAPMGQGRSDKGSTAPAVEERTRDETNTTTLGRAVERPAISRQKQKGHVEGTAQNQNRLKQGTPTSTFDGDAAQADALTHEAWEKGTPVPNRIGIRDYDFRRRIGTTQNGKGQSVVRVHQDSKGEIHGHPSGKDFP